MRDELYGDRKDIIKWSLVEKRCRDKTISEVYYTAMLCAPLGMHGHDRSLAELSHPSIQSFFEQERAIFDADPLERRVARIVELPARAGLNFALDACLLPFPGGHRGVYFNRVVRALSAKSVPQAVLVDPDNGVQGIQISGQSTSRPGRTRVCPQEIRDILEVIQPGSIVLLYQDYFRNTDWINVAQRSVQHMIGGMGIVTPYPFAGVMFLEIVKL